MKSERVGRRHLLWSADLAVSALSPYVDYDWSVRAGPLEWDVEQTISHMVGAVAKYTLYLASGSQSFIGLTCTRFKDATHAELLKSIQPIATGLANVADWVPEGSTAFHASGPSNASEFVTIACIELLVHSHDALQGLGGYDFSPPEDLAGAVLRSGHPGACRRDSAWRSLLEATGRGY